MVQKQTNVSSKNTSASEVAASPTMTTPMTSQTFVSKAERRGSPQPVGKPHRITYDCTDARYRQLKLASMNTGESMNAIISSAIDDWLAAHPEALEI
jgi:hypothetical protein